jgi:hypothetical protein
MKWIGNVLEGKGPWRNRGSISAFAWEDWRKPLTDVNVVGNEVININSCNYLHNGTKCRFHYFNICFNTSPLLHATQIRFVQLDTHSFDSTQQYSGGAIPFEIKISIAPDAIKLQPRHLLRQIWLDRDSNRCLSKWTSGGPSAVCITWTGSSMVIQWYAVKVTYYTTKEHVKSPW